MLIFMRIVPESCCELALVVLPPPPPLDLLKNRSFSLLRLKTVFLSFKIRSSRLIYLSLSRSIKPLHHRFMILRETPESQSFCLIEWLAHFYSPFLYWLPVTCPPPPGPLDDA